VTSLKTAWKNMRTKAKVKGRWHDNRHTLITELAETIMEIAGHVDRQMLRHYSHIRMKAKRNALEAGDRRSRWQFTAEYRATLTTPSKDDLTEIWTRSNFRPGRPG
jgi:hypothetical protein